jgi:hypothetical protein
MQPNRSLWMTQRAIMLQLLRDDHDPLWTRSELRAHVPDFDSSVFDVALERLDDDTCVVLDDEGAVRASTCARHLDALGLISV